MMRKTFVVTAAIICLSSVNPASAGEFHQPFTFSNVFNKVEDPRTWESNLRTQIARDENSGLVTPVQAQSLLDAVGQVAQEHQTYLNQNGAPNGNVLTPGERNQIAQQLAAVNQTRQTLVSENGGNKYFHDPFGKPDPREWERSLIDRIRKDEAEGLLTPPQAQFRLDQVSQVQQEHQTYLNQNGAPTGNVLTDSERQQIKQQLESVNREREDDIHHNHPRK